MFLKIGNEITPAIIQKATQSVANYVRPSTILPTAEKAVSKGQYTSPFAIIADAAATPTVKVENVINRNGLDFFA